MKLISLNLILLFSVLLVNCEKKEEKYPINKRYWTVDDYTNVTRTLRFGIEPDEKLPTFNDPATRIVVVKYTDPQNYIVVLDDKELGVKHKNKIAQAFFMKWKDMVNVYTARDRKDNFVYEKEMLKVFHFGLGLQQRYFKIGNEEILESTDKAIDAKETINSNISVLIGNYKLYLNFINDEKSFSNEGKKVFSEGLVKYYKELINMYPKVDYRSTKSKMITLKEKSKGEVIKNALTEIIELINDKQKLNKK